MDKNGVYRPQKTMNEDGFYRLFLQIRHDDHMYKETQPTCRVSLFMRTLLFAQIQPQATFTYHHSFMHHLSGKTPSIITYTSTHLTISPPQSLSPPQPLLPHPLSPRSRILPLPPVGSSPLLSALQHPARKRAPKPLDALAILGEALPRNAHQEPQMRRRNECVARPRAGRLKPDEGLETQAHGPDSHHGGRRGIRLGCDVDGAGLAKASLEGGLKENLSVRRGRSKDVKDLYEE